LTGRWWDANLKPIKGFEIVIGRKTIFLGDMEMQSRIYFLVVICLVSLASVGFGHVTVGVPVSFAVVTDVNAPSFPYVAEIISDDVYIRSGPGTDYYSCGKLGKNNRVKVIAQKYDLWSHIIPPAGCYSWISSQYVSVNRSNPTVGIVTGDNVRVRAGSADGNPLHSDTVQTKLNKRDSVTLLGEENSGYYKIVPPEGAYLWVSTDYTKVLGPVEKFPLEVKNEDKPEDTSVVPMNISVVDARLKEYYILEKQMETERAKPMEKQNYAAIKKALTEIANDKGAGKAARYAEFAIKQVERSQLALMVTEIVKLQDAEYERILEQIEKVRLKKLAAVQDLSRFTAVGQFQISNIYDGSELQQKLYRILDEDGRITCYVLPTGSAANMDLAEFVGSDVGLMGTIEPHPQTANALVRFTEITVLK
jgi:uncharacterized protein YgiM (DUF1202 family)